MIQTQRDKQSKAGAGFRRNEWNVILGDLRAGEVLKVERRGFAENLAQSLELQPPSATSGASLRQPYCLWNIRLTIIAYI